ncbi:MAG: phosphate transport system regulator PhoU, partial [Gammaproteobacteria bacterium]|nr:phosphate transport system regulator PhoU [Gammaproteobacteria bacterium]
MVTKVNTEAPSGGHISKRFDSELEDIKNKVLTMGGQVETQLNNGIIALMESDSTVAEMVANGDDIINAMEVEIDEQCLQILARRQPA